MEEEVKVHNGLLSQRRKDKAVNNIQFMTKLEDTHEQRDVGTNNVEQTKLA